MDKYIGRLLDNRYEILEIIGTGGMAVVYKARCHRLNRLVAIKILKNDYLEDEDFRRRFHAESQAVAMLSHPNIVSVYDVSTSISLEADYIVMELIEGITLKQYMEKKGVLNWKETLHFAMQIAKALEHAHSRGIVHRDIKPHNVMVLKNGSVKVTDFGIARLMSKGDTLTKEALGSVHYISPEQAKGGRVDDRSDIYSLGVVMYEMMAGRPPYEGESPVTVAIQHINGGAVMPSTLNPNIPGGMEQIIMKAMAHEIVDRYSSATQMLADMDEFRKDPGLNFSYTQSNVIPIPVVRPQPDRMAERAQAHRESRQKAASAAAASAAVEAARKQQQSQRKAQKRQQGGRSKAAVVAIIMCAIALILAIILFLMSCGPQILDGFGKKLVEVPPLIGKYYEDLRVYSGLEIQVTGEAYHEEYKAGQIIHQQPMPGEQVAMNTEVSVTVSLGKEPEPVLMPNLVELSQSRAQEILDTQSLNLLYRVEEEYHDSIPAGNVIRTDPQVDTPLESGQTVILYVSKGMQTKSIIMPALVSQKIDTVTNMLLTYGFPEPEMEYLNSREPVGIVIGQSVEEGERVDLDTVIRLQVSKGPEPTEPPVIMDVTIDLTGKIPGENTYVLIKRGSSEVYNQAVGPETTSVTLRNQAGNGTVKYQVYVDDQLVATESVVFS